MQRNTEKMLIVLFTLFICSFGQDYWKKTYHEECVWADYCITQLHNKSIVMAGHTGPINDPNNFVRLLRIDLFGWKIDQKDFREIQGIRLNDVIELSDGSILCIGAQYPVELGGPKLWLFRLSKDFKVIWQKSYSEFGDIHNPQVIEASDNTLIITANASSTITSGVDVLFLKLSMSGDVLDSKSIGTNKGDNIGDVLLLADNNVLIAFYGYTPEVNDTITLLKCTDSGDALWSRKLKQPGVETNARLCQDKKGNIIMAAETHPEGGGDRDLWLVKLTKEGSVIWTKTFGGPDYEDMGEVHVYPDGDILILATTQSYGAGAEDIWIIKTDKEGNCLWKKTIGNGFPNFGKEIVPLHNGSLLLNGGTAIPNFKKGTAWLIMVLPDQYAFHNMPFTYQIPVASTPEDFTYSPLSVPSGMSISPRGTISWQPAITTPHKEHIQLLVQNKTTKEKDTLSLNIYVNDTNHTTPLVDDSRHNALQTNTIQVNNNLHTKTLSISSSHVDLFVDIYTGHGSKIASLRSKSSKGSTASISWDYSKKASMISTGHYFLRIHSGGRVYNKSIIVMQ